MIKIYVRTNESIVEEFNANNCKMNKDGTLFVKNDDVVVAVFNTGCWMSYIRQEVIS